MFAEIIFSLFQACFMSSTSVSSQCWHLLPFFIQFEILLVLGMISDFTMKPEH